MNKDNPKKVVATSASVKIMRSYDYCHFEITLSSGVEGEFETLDSVDELRKEAARLCDKAVRQYKEMKALTSDQEAKKWHFDNIEHQVKLIKENYPKSEWTPEQKAVVKKHEDTKFYMSLDYDYEDDWVEPETPF